MTTPRSGTRPARLLFLCFATAMILTASIVEAAAAGRIALVLGNAAYRHTTPLLNPRHDAADMAAALRSVGFEVIEGLDLDRNQMLDTIQKFTTAVRGAEVAVLFYSGHGLQVASVNYVVPVDAKLTRVEDADRDAIRIDAILGPMEREAQTTIVFLDACRDNPLAQTLTRTFGGRTGAERGLAPVRSGKTGTFISFATAPNTVALDGDGRNSPYTAALKRRISQAGRDIGTIMIDVRNDVIAATAERQVPWEHSSLRVPFFFVPPAAGKRAGAVSSPECPQGAVSAQVGTERRCVAPGERFKDCEACPEMVALPAGAVLMGSAPDEPGRYDDEGPRRVVVLARPIAVARTHVTRGAFAAFVKDTGHRPDSGCYALQNGRWAMNAGATWDQPGFQQDDRHPVVCISWNDAVAYVAWLSKAAGPPYRLMSEPEAEYANRAATEAGDQPPYFFGSAPADVCHYGNGADEAAARVFPDWTVAPCRDGYVHTAPVASFKPNAFGLHDTVGNVWTWTADCYTPNLTHAGAAAGPCSERVLRGGSWHDGPRDLRSANRSHFDAAARFGHVGLRIARALDD